MSSSLQKWQRWQRRAKARDSERVTKFAANKFRQTVLLFDFIRTRRSVTVQQCQRFLFGTTEASTSERRQARRLMRRLHAAGVIEFNPGRVGGNHEDHGKARILGAKHRLPKKKESRKK